MTQIKKPKGDFLDDVYTLLHPMRFRIVKLLAEKPMNITEISKAMGEDGRPVATNYNLRFFSNFGMNSKI
jgi:DNA-binding transcriptional ArsR family regulator